MILYVIAQSSTPDFLKFSQELNPKTLCTWFAEPHANFESLLYLQRTIWVPHHNAVCNTQPLISMTIHPAFQIGVRWFICRSSRFTKLSQCVTWHYSLHTNYGERCGCSSSRGIIEYSGWSRVQRIVLIGYFVLHFQSPWLCVPAA